MKTSLSHNRLVRIVVLGFAAVALLALFGIAAVRGATGLAGNSAVIKQHDFGSWSYSATRDDRGTLSADVQFDANSVEGIHAFANANKILADELASKKGDVEVFVVFNEPMDVAAYRVWAKNSGINYFEGTQVMAVDGRTPVGGNPLPPIQIFLSPDSPDALSQASLDAAIKQTSGVTGGSITIKGVTSVQGKVNPMLLPAIASDTKVLISDVTANVVRNELLSANISGADQVSIHTSAPVFVMLDILSKGTSKTK